jgi:ABC-type nitrate/sulfonate/bicarbonate transport system permease component
LAIGGALGWATGLTMALHRTVRVVVEPFAEMLRPVPPIILIPFAILWFGLGTTSQVILIALGAFMVLLVSTYEAAATVPPRYLLAAQSMGASRRLAFLKVVVPAIRPHLKGPARIAAGTAFGLTVAAEYLGAQGGLGYLVRNARVTLNTETVALASILLGIEAVAFDRLLRWFWDRRTRWAEGTAEQHTPVETAPVHQRRMKS